MSDDIHITGVVFGQEVCQIGFAESRHQSEKGSIEQSLTILSRDIEPLLNDIKEVLIDVVDDFLLKLRMPPDELPGAGDARTRLKDRIASDKVD